MISFIRDNWGEHLAAMSSPFWIYERHTNKKSRCFVRIQGFDKVFWLAAAGREVTNNSKDHTFCYLLSGDDSWWGFRKETDAVLFFMKWG